LVDICELGHQGKPNNGGSRHSIRRSSPGRAQGTLGGRAGSNIFQLDEDRVCWGGPDVFSPMTLGVEPTDFARRQRYLTRLLADADPAIESTQRDHHAIGMYMQAGLRTGLVAVLEYSY